MSITIPPSIKAALDHIPADIRQRSGSLFYSGQRAFSAPSPIYLLGLNPGGSPDRQSRETVGKDIDDFQARRIDWSAYADQSWESRAPGTHGMQPRILRMLRQLRMNPREVPASNVVFVRTRNEAALQDEKPQLLSACWPVHEAVISALGIRSVVCFGGTAGRWVRDQMNANELVDEFRESNLRGWASLAHRCADGRAVITVTHPSRADWTNPAADPTPLIARMLGANR